MSTSTFHRAAGFGAAVVLGAITLTACGANEAEDGGEGGGGATIALLLPETATTRYEEHDRPLFEAKVEELCSDCEILYQNADQDESKQAEQLTSVLDQGADVVVLDPVNFETAAGMVDEAQSQDVPVIAYDRFIENADYYMSFDNETVGRLQAEALVEAMGDEGSILMLNGAPSDPNAAQFKAGAHSVIDESGLTVLAEFDNPDWSPEQAQQWTTDQLNKYDPSEIDGVYAANDGQAGGVIAALTGADVPADALPPVTGQDAEIAAIQRILVGEQAMTIYKSIKLEAETAAEVAVALADGEEAPATTETGVEQTDFEGVPSYIFDPVVVTADNVNDTVIADGFYEASDICTGDYVEACEAAGIS
ncbi:substrate-binding domain-containing protein [Nocardioides antri]|uniref:Sugar ABC transporter substrate-binding protein n=1 Tax=Nocardioides antri TaxID=2607659 RepID=A0A5B1M268_9ACTN|nr:substrate-binding domain-containing protein [Nocardioides antri]KAA1427275.1 sugar ABC transporter substrate-binding protein [Nocardioides antri]